jgi:hypothetical protein
MQFSSGSLSAQQTGSSAHLNTFPAHSSFFIDGLFRRFEMYQIYTSMKNKFLWLIAAVTLLFNAELKAQVPADLIIDLTTGTGPVGTQDPIWTQVSGPSGILPALISNGSVSEFLDITTPYAQNECGGWISPYVVTNPMLVTTGTIRKQASDGSNVDYNYIMTFNNDAVCPVRDAVITMDFVGADNELTGFIVNGTFFPVPPGIDFSPLTTSLTVNIPGVNIVSGVNTVEAVVHNVSSWTAFFMCGNITVSYMERWNQTTTNTASGDIGNDVVVDQFGDVYVAGTFRTWTEFPSPSCPNLVINGGDESAYIAKYSACGKLLWVNYEQGDGHCKGTGIAYDPVRNMVYLTGTEGGPAVGFFTNPAVPCGPAASGVVTSTPEHFYVARFNATTGSFLDIRHHTVTNAVTMKPNTYIGVRNFDANRTDIYVVASYTHTTDDEILLMKIRETTGAYANLWSTTSLASAIGPKVANDIAVDPVLARVYITGTFIKKVGFGSTTLNTTALSDAFVWEFATSTGVSAAGKCFGMSNVTRAAEGTSLIAGAGNKIYATGFFNADQLNVFGSASGFTGGPSGYRSYVVAFNSGLATISWAKEIQPAVGRNIKTTGIAVSESANQVVVTGTMTGSIASPTVMTTNGTFTSASGTPKMFLAAYSTTGTPFWANATKDAVAGSVHTSTKLATDGDISYTTGGYINQMNYVSTLTPPPASGALMSAPLGRSNTYVVRNNLPFYGAFYKTGNETASEEVKAGLNFEKNGAMNVYPNPSEGIFTVDIAQLSFTGDETIEVFDMSGKRISQMMTVAGKTSYQLDLSSYPKGIYMLKTTTNEKVQVQQIHLH